MTYHVDLKLQVTHGDPANVPGNPDYCDRVGVTNSVFGAIGIALGVLGGILLFIFPPAGVAAAGVAAAGVAAAGKVVTVLGAGLAMATIPTMVMDSHCS